MTQDVLPPHARNRMRSNPGQTKGKVSRGVVCVLLAAAVGGMAVGGTMTGCQSAFDNQTADRGSARLSDSLIAHSILQGTYTGDVHAPTVAQGVREMPRVDSPGPGNGDSAVVPASTSPADTTIPGGGTGAAPSASTEAAVTPSAA